MNELLLVKQPILLATVGELCRAELRDLQMKLNDFLSLFPSIFLLSLNEKKAKMVSLVVYLKNMKEWTMCPDFVITKECPNHVECPFLHGENDARLTTVLRETNSNMNGTKTATEELSLGRTDEVLDVDMDDVVGSLEPGRITVTNLFEGVQVPLWKHMQRKHFM